MHVVVLERVTVCHDNPSNNSEEQLLPPVLLPGWLKGWLACSLLGRNSISEQPECFSAGTKQVSQLAQSRFPVEDSPTGARLIRELID